MRTKIFAGAAVIVFIATLASNAQAQCVVTSYNPVLGIPPGYTAEQGFKGRFDYPAVTTEKTPDFLIKEDFTKDWRSYLNAALNYAFEGNEDGTEAGVPTAFRVQANHKRNWYHGLWMDRTDSGREFLHGLTSERASRDNQLGDEVHGGAPTWAIGFYNEIGATTFAKVFKDPCQPDLSEVLFPIGTVSFKLLFSGASDATIPYLKDSPMWLADIDRKSATPTSRVGRLHLLQVDIAIRDPRAGKTGWVFGTYVYSDDVKSTDPWRRLKPVGLMWGNDADKKLGEPVVQSVINTDLHNVTYGWPGRLEMGWKGRLNGPLDNLISSCQSCHGSAQFPRSATFNNYPSAAVDDSGYNQRLADYFRDIAPGEVFDPVTHFLGDTTPVHAISMDYSLQIQTGLEHLCASAKKKEKPFDTLDIPKVCVPSSWTNAPLMTNSADQATQRKELNEIDWDALNAPVR